MQHATRNIHAGQDAIRQDDQEGAAFWVVLYAVLMVAALTFLAGANLIGDRFDPSSSIAWADPA